MTRFARDAYEHASLDVVKVAIDRASAARPLVGQTTAYHRAAALIEVADMVGVNQRYNTAP